MAKMSEMIIGMIQQHLVCLQRFVKAGELSASDLEFVVNHAWKIEWYAECLLTRRLLNKKRKKIKTKRASALFIYKEIVWNTILHNL